MFSSFWPKKKIKIVTHNGDFHADDVFACAALLLWAEKSRKKISIIRSRDNQVIKSADIVVDVGGVYDDKLDRFDHHQRGGAGSRKNDAGLDIPYASFGLVWRKYGSIICGNEKIAERIERDMVMKIDAMDNGLISPADSVHCYSVGKAIGSLVPTWLEDKNNTNKMFFEALKISTIILIRERASKIAEEIGMLETAKEIESQGRPKILVLPKHFDWHESVVRETNVKIVIYPDGDKNWGIQVARNSEKNLNSVRAVFPEEWWGLRDGDLEKISGVRGAIFCINRGWFAVARSKEAALMLANKAIIKN